MAKAIWGLIFATYLLGFMSCGHYVVDQIEVSWEDDIERDRREIMHPPYHKIKRKSYNQKQWGEEYVSN